MTTRNSAPQNQDVHIATPAHTDSDTETDESQTHQTAEPSAAGCIYLTLLGAAAIAGVVHFANIPSWFNPKKPQDNKGIDEYPLAVQRQQALEQRDILIEAKVGDTYTPIFAYIGGGWEQIRDIPAVQTKPTENRPSYTPPHGGAQYILRADGRKIGFENWNACNTFMNALIRSERSDKRAKRLKIDAPVCPMYDKDYGPKQIGNLAERVASWNNNNSIHTVTEQEAKQFEKITETQQPDGHGGGLQHVLSYKPK